MKTYGQLHYEANKEAYIQRAKDWYFNNKDKKKEYDKLRYESKKEELRKYEQERRKLPHRRAAHAEETRKRRMALKQASPNWLTQEDKSLIKDLYTLAAIYNQYSGIKWHVDHMYPLRGDLVCGLHVPNNLQIISATDNIKKHNKHFELDRRVYAEG